MALQHSLAASTHQPATTLLTCWASNPPLSPLNPRRRPPPLPSSSRFSRLPPPCLASCATRQRLWEWPSSRPHWTTSAACWRRRMRAATVAGGCGARAPTTEPDPRPGSILAAAAGCLAAGLLHVSPRNAAHTTTCAGCAAVFTCMCHFDLYTSLPARRVAETANECHPASEDMILCACLFCTGPALPPSLQQIFLALPPPSVVTFQTTVLV